MEPAAACPFHVVVAGRAPQALLPVAGAARWAAVLEAANLVQHLAVFAVAPLPPDAAGAIYLQWPGAEWRLIGFLAPDRPSAIFKLGAERARPASGDVEMAPEPTAALLGIALEPLAPLLARGAPTQPAPRPALGADDLALFGRRMLESFVHFAQSFTFPATPPPPAAGPVHVVPADVIDKWYANFRRRLDLDPNFWRAPAPAD